MFALVFDCPDNDCVQHAEVEEWIAKTKQVIPTFKIIEDYPSSKESPQCRQFIVKTLRYIIARQGRFEQADYIEWMQKEIPPHTLKKDQAGKGLSRFDFGAMWDVGFSFVSIYIVYETTE